MSSHPTEFKNVNSEHSEILDKPNEIKPAEKSNEQSSENKLSEIKPNEIESNEIESNEDQPEADQLVQSTSGRQDGKADKRTVRFIKKCKKIITNAYTLKKRKNKMSKKNADSTEQFEIHRKEESNSFQQLNDIQVSEQLIDDQINENQSSDQENEVSQSNDQVNVRQSDDLMNDEESNTYSTDVMNVDKNLPKNTQVDTSNDVMNVENVKEACDTDLNEKLSQPITQSNSKQMNSATSNENKQNGKEQAIDKIPDLLLTENNQSNRGSKLVICVMLLFKFFTYFIIKIIHLFHPSKKNVLEPINEPLLLLSAGELTERIKNGQVRCEQVIRAYINRIESVQSKLNTIVDNCFEDALKRAREIDEQIKDPKLAEELRKLPLLGVPFTCKDSIAVKGLAHTAGVKIRKGIKADKDATVISNLRSAGAIFLCVTNTPELVLWWDSENKLYGRTNNPYDISRIAGGSSGGEGSLISAAGSLIGVGSDVAGSIRIPAMFNGVFGHKTILKYITVDGMFPPPSEVSGYKRFLCYGPICRYAKDIPLALKAMGGSLTDELKLDEPVDFKKIKIYYMEHDGGNALASFVDQRIINTMHKVMNYFKSEYNMQTEKINIRKFKYAIPFFATACAGDSMKIQDYVSRDGHVNVFWELFKSCFGRSEYTRPILVQILNQNSSFCDPNSASYKKITRMLEELKPKVHELLSDNAVLIMPTWPTLAPKHQTTILRGFDASYTSIMNALEIPATHCPVGLTKEEGLPVGFTVAAGPGCDRISIAFAKEIEKVFKGWVSPPSK